MRPRKVPCVGRGMVSVLVGTVSVLLVNRPAGVVALSNRCTHRGAPLGEGSLQDGCLECPWHGSRLGVADGRVGEGQRPGRNRCTTPECVTDGSKSGKPTNSGRSAPTLLPVATSDGAKSAVWTPQRGRIGYAD
ncbi:Rieske 2Fe-2S domain-containing protein [Rhodococcus sp. NPDC056960]|uniref:Rieske (2Fe-2S) protein n=1 Tax=Rhodococcus sp. NPDC056960 TaxID=3345982 RepID=UPI0036292F9E